MLPLVGQRKSDMESMREFKKRGQESSVRRCGL